jgi:hypothetical protein
MTHANGSGSPKTHDRKALVKAIKRLVKTRSNAPAEESDTHKTDKNTDSKQADDSNIFASVKIST